MPINPPAELTLQNELANVAQQIDSAKHGTKNKVLNDVCTRFGWSQSRLYRELAGIGWTSNRKQRSDAGKTACSEDSLGLIAAMRMQSQRKNGKLTMPTTVARSIAMQNGNDVAVSVSTVNRQLRMRNLANQDIKSASPSTRVQSKHPNHVHQVDPSLCLIYYSPNGQQYMMQDDEFYKNKPDNFAKVKLKCWRYVLTDHYSNTIIARYYAAAGENSENMWDFLCYAWQKLGNRVFHGVPDILYWDKGSANQSSAIKNALNELDVKHISHEVGRARAKGSVEGANNTVETQFECRLKLEPVDNVQQLNAAVEHWYNAFNSNSIQNQDTRLNRRGMHKPVARYALWQTIRATNIRELPHLDMCKKLLSSKPQTRTVNANLIISFVHPKVGKTGDYSLKDCAGVLVGMKVQVCTLFYSDAAVKVMFKRNDGTSAAYTCQPVAYDTLSGMPLNAPVYGEDFNAMPDTSVEKGKKAGDKLAYPGLDQDEIKKAKAKQKAPFGGTINAHSHLADSANAAPGFMQKSGDVITPPSMPVFNEKPMSLIAAKTKIAAQLHRDLTSDEITWLHASYTTVLPNDLDSILQQFRDGVPTAPLLRVVNK
jgi:hypothetical protein